MRHLKCPYKKYLLHKLKIYLSFPLLTNRSSASSVAVVVASFTILCLFPRARSTTRIKTWILFSFILKHSAFAFPSPGFTALCANLDHQTKPSLAAELLSSRHSENGCQQIFSANFQQRDLIQIYFAHSQKHIVSKMYSICYLKIQIIILITDAYCLCHWHISTIWSSSLTHKQVTHDDLWDIVMRLMVLPNIMQIHR